MPGLLIDERVVVVQPSLVRALGSMTAAAVVQQLHYWMPRATAEHDGHRWVYKTAEQWSDEIGVTVKQVRSAITRLESLGIVLSCQPERSKWQRRKWYRIDYDHPLIARDADEYRCAQTGTSNGPSGNIDVPSGELRGARTGTSIREITTEITEESTEETRPTSSNAAPAMIDEPTRLANLLADLIEANGSKRPTVTKAWVTTIDRMIRLDDRTVEQVEKAIRWAQGDEFWRANILSPDALRRQFDRMRLQARRGSSGPRGLAGVRDFLATLDSPLTGGSRNGG